MQSHVRSKRESADPVRPVDRKPAQGRKAEGGSDHAQDSSREPRIRGFLKDRPYLAWALAAAFVGAVAGAVIWWLGTRDYETTDDAFIDARNVSISSQVTGVITSVPVTDNQRVEPGGVLVQIDQLNYQSAADQAQAQVAQAQATVANLDAQIAEQKARIEQAEKQVAQLRAAATFARQENQRAQDLARRGAGTEQQAQQTSSSLMQADANVASAEANAQAAQKQIPVLETQRQSVVAQLAQAQASLMLAQANLDRTRITAPTAGRATKISAAIGALAQPGQVLMIFVPEEKWVTANFKETQLTFMRPGQKVEIRIDAYPGRVFSGRVDSIQAGSGAAFSLLPPENATGNFVKVVQRVPVKIVFDEPPDVYIGPGMSVVPSLKVR